MAFRYLDKDGALSFWTNIKNFILSKIPTKTSELTNDSGFLTQHQSLSNYVTLNSEQTISGKKLFTNTTTKVNSVNTFTGSTQFIDLSTTVPRGEFPESAYRVGRVYIGDNTSYNGAWFIIDPTIETDKVYYRMVTTSPDNSDSARFSITWDSTKEGARRRRLTCMGDLICASNNTYQIGESGNAWKDAYINNVHGISDYTNFLTSTLNANTTLTHASHGRRTILAMGTITLTVPAPEEGSWFLIKAVNGSVTLNLANNVSVTGITAGVFSGPIHLLPNESILLCYYSSTIYNATISTIRRSGVVGRTGNAPAENPKNWFKIAENYVTATYRDPFICLRVFESTTGNTIGTLCAHCRINNTIGVVDTSNCYLQWQDAGSGIDLSKYALTTSETSGTGVTITLWCKLEGGYSSVKYEVISEYGQSDQLGNPEWVLVRRRQTDGDLAELLDTDFTKIVYSTLTILKNNTTGTASNVTGTVAIANGGTGATSRLSAIKNLTNESVGTPTHFLAITTNWGKAGYTTVAQAKTVLGITGDIVSHNASEFLTSHQSLANYLTKTTNVSEMGRYIDLHYDNATSKYDYDARLYVDSQGTAAGGGSFKIAAASAYAPAPASNANDTRIATTAWVNSKGYLTSHPSITLSTNTTSTASPAHGGTFTCIDSVTQDTNGHITKVNTKTITLPADNNTDTKVTQTVTTANSGYPVLLCATANATATETTTSRFSEGLAVNARYSVIYMTNKYDTANTKGVRDSTTGYLNGDIIFRCYDTSEMGRIHCESSKNGYQQTYMQARSYIKNGAISPEGTATTCYITVRVRDNGSKTIYTDGSWENSLTPYINETYDLGTSSLRWMRCYCKNFYGSYVDIAGRYLENEFSTNARTCLYLKSNRDTDGKSGIYFSKFRQNVAQGALTGPNLVSLSLDVLENSVRTNGCIAIDFRYFENDVPTKIYVIPKASMTSYMGTADNPWTNAYITNLILNGNAFDPASTSGNIGDIVFACAYYSSITGTSALELTVSGNVLYLAGFDNTTLVIASTSSSLPGTWKFLGTGKPTTTSGNADTKRVGLWKRIA